MLKNETRLIIGSLFVHFSLKHIFIVPKTRLDLQKGDSLKSIGILTFIVVSTLAHANKKDERGLFFRPTWTAAPLCADRPDFLSEPRSESMTSFSDLPSVVLIARDAEYFIEGHKDNERMKLYGYQSFLRPQAGRVLCGDASEKIKDRMSVWAPTLIDNQEEATVGQSVWQFQMLVDSGRFAFWNFKKPSLETRQGLESLIKASGATFKIYQRAHDEYEVLIVKKEGPMIQYLTVRYDAIRKMK